MLCVGLCFGWVLFLTVWVVAVAWFGVCSLTVAMKVGVQCVHVGGFLVGFFGFRRIFSYFPTSVKGVGACLGE